MVHLILGEGCTLDTKGLYIPGGRVEAVSANGCGLLLLSKDGKINISGGEVTASGTGTHPGISLENGTVTISGGTVTASGAYYAIGICAESAELNGLLAVSGESTVLRAYSGRGAAIGAYKEMTLLNFQVWPGATVETWSPGKGDSNGWYQDQFMAYVGSQVFVGSRKDGAGAAALPAAETIYAHLNKDYKYMRVQPCRHPEGTFDKTETTHLRKCSYCLTEFAEEPHELVGGVCQVCGYHEADKAAVSFDQGAMNADGAMEPVSVEKGSEYTLPACGYMPPQGVSFEYWDLNGTFMRPGDVITVSEDITLTAIWSHFHGEIHFEPWMSSTSLPGISAAEAFSLAEYCQRVGFWGRM